MDELRLNPVYYTRRAPRACASRCAASWPRRSRRTSPPGTRRAASRASCTRAPRTSACSGSAFPEEYGGIPGVGLLPPAGRVPRTGAGGSGGLVASLMSHTIGAPPVAALGSAGTQAARAAAECWPASGSRRWRSPSRRGGSDVAALRTTARARRRRTTCVDGEKTFITSGMRADFLTVAVRTDPAARGAQRPLAAAGRGRHAGIHAHAARQDGLVGLGHGAPALRRLPGAGRQPARPGGRRASSRSCTTSTPSASRWRRSRGRLRLGLLPGGARLGARAPHVRPAARRPPGGATPAASTC